MKTIRLLVVEKSNSQKPPTPEAMSPLCAAGETLHDQAHTPRTKKTGHAGKPALLIVHISLPSEVGDGTGTDIWKRVPQLGTRKGEDEKGGP